MKKCLVVIFVFIIFLGLLQNYGCRRVLNIAGIWEVTLDIFLFGERVIETYEYLFEGDKYDGLVIYDGEVLGDYSVAGDNVYFILQYLDLDDDLNIETYNGSFNNRNNMSGTFTWTIEGYGTWSGVWTAVR